MHYRRAKAEGGTYFFTVNLADRSSDILVRNIDDLIRYAGRCLRQDFRGGGKKARLSVPVG